MKRIYTLISGLTLLTLAGCSRNMSANPSINTGDNAQVNSGKTNEIVGMQYSGELILAGLGPDESFESTVAKDTLVLKKTFDDHSDHIFFPRQTWSNYLDIQDDMLPGNHVDFVGTVKALEAAAGNRYYEVVTIDRLIVVGPPSQSELETLVQRYAYCEQDNDCVGIYGKCPLGCHIATNTNFQPIVERMVDNFWNNQDTKCTYKCAEIGKVVCGANNICEVK